MKIKWRGYECSLQWERYAEGGGAALRLTTREDQNHQDQGWDEPMATCTTNLERGQVLENGEAAIKDWSENAGMVIALVEAGLIEQPHRFVRSGYVEVPIVRWRKNEAGQFPWEWPE